MLHELRKESEWASCLAEAGIPTIFLSRDFSRLYSSDPVLLVCRQGRDMAAFVYSRDKDKAIGLRYGGVITNCRNQSFGSEVVSVLTEYFHAQGVINCRFRNHPFLNTIPIGDLLGEEPFVFIDLTRSRKELVAAITKQHRRCIRRAQESGLEVTYSADNKYLRIFNDLYQACLAQNGIEPKDFVFFKRMFSILNDHLIFAVVRDASKILAVSILLKDGDDIFMTYGGMSQEGYHLHAKHIMIYDIMLKSKEKSFKRLVLGTGSTGKDSIYQFKKGFANSESTIRIYGIR